MIHPLVFVIGIPLLVFLSFFTFFTVKQNTVAAVERFGKFRRFSRAGLGVKVPFIDGASNRRDLRVQEMDVPMETTTNDNVTVKIRIVVQYFVLESKLMEAFYRLQDPQRQITSYVMDTVRTQVRKMDLDVLLGNKDDIAHTVKQGLAAVMEDFGYGIHNTLVTDVRPEPKVEEAMNEINAAQRQRVAAEARGEAEKTLTVKAAEAQAESKRLQGEGIANQRAAIIKGLQESMHAFRDAVPGAAAEDVMRLVLMTQYMDTLKEIGMSGKTNTVFLQHSPGGLTDLESQIRSALLSADAATGGSKVPNIQPSIG